MRFITTLNNQKCMEWKINATQGILFSLLYEANNWAVEEIIENKTYYFVSRNLIMEELPMFFEKSDTVYRNLKILQEKGLIEYTKKGKKDLIRITAKGKSWNFIKQKDNSGKNPSFDESSEKNPSNLGKKSEKEPKISEKNPTNKDTISYKDNNIINNNIYSSVINYLNEKTERTGKEKYNPESSKTQRLIKARRNEGYELEDFKIVIDKKCKEWLGTDMEKYLRPETLFGNKFESYLKQKTTTTKKPKFQKQNNDFAVTEEGLKKFYGCEWEE